MDDIWTLFQPHIMEILSIFIAAIITVAAAQFRTWTGIQIEARHREALHDALMSGVAAAIRSGPPAGVDLVKEKAIAHARESVPDAIRKLTPSDGVLGRIAERYIKQMIGSGQGAAR